MASVGIRSVVKNYGAVKVLKSVDVDVLDGEFTVLVGPSGCGKTTLLRMIAGLESVTGGEIHIEDEVVNDLPPKDRDIAMVFQNYALYPHMTVAENMGFSMSVRGERRNAIREKVARAAAILGLAAYLDRYPRELSGGQRQRVAMGRAIVREPRVFLFDEPLSNLDAKLRNQMRAEIKSLMHELRATTIYVTHDQVEAMTMADKMVVMRDGIVEQIGTPLEVYDTPASLFVAGFIGSPSMNFFRGRLHRAGADRLVLADGALLELPAGTTLPAETEIVAGIRPEDIAIGVEGLEAMVKVIEPTGSETLVLLTRNGGEITLVSRTRLALEPGQKVHLQLDMGAAHFFDVTTEKRL